MDIDLNKGFYADLDTNFYQACEMCDKNFSHSELIEMLKNGNIPQKQIAALKLDGVYSNEEAQALIANLTGCDGKIREAVALRIYQILCENKNAGKFFNYPKVFANATIDINANICRLVVDSSCLMRSVSGFAKEYADEIVKFINEALKELDSFIYRDKKYIINKQLFKLYWCLETLKNFQHQVDAAALSSLLQKCVQQKEYTIREKVAQIIMGTDKYSEIRKKLMSDENYYVRAALHTTV